MAVHKQYLSDEDVSRIRLKYPDANRTPRLEQAALLTRADAVELRLREQAFAVRLKYEWTIGELQVAGVYVMLGADINNVLYIGESASIVRRLTNHMVSHSAGNSAWGETVWFGIAESTERKQLEAYLLENIPSKYNRTV